MIAPGGSLLSGDPMRAAHWGTRGLLLSARFSARFSRILPPMIRPSGSGAILRALSAAQGMIWLELGGAVAAPQVDLGEGHAAKGGRGSSSAHQLSRGHQLIPLVRGQPRAQLCYLPAQRIALRCRFLRE